MTMPGASGYLSAPSNTLDPSLFTVNEVLMPDVRNFLARRVLDALAQNELSEPRKWVHAWLAGSGISYQWQADRGNGDLDVLMGVDYSGFARCNPAFAGIDEKVAAAAVNEWLRANIWPATANQVFGNSSYEITFFWSAGAGNRIKKIRPYAAYDILNDKWVVHPARLPSNPAGLYPQEWFAAADRDFQATADLLAGYQDAGADFDAAPVSSADRHNAGARLNLTASQARALFTDIHAGRREAFGEQGHGYGDWHNFRWQLAKKNGVISGLKGIIRKSDADEQQRDKELYGGKISGAQDVLYRASLWNTGRLQ